MNDLAMTQAVDHLTNTERAAFTHVRLRGFSIDEAVGRSGSTSSDVKIAVHRAACKLQTLLREGSI